MSATSPRLTEYFTPVGKLTIACAHAEEVVLLWLAQLSEEDPRQFHRRHLFTGFRKRLELLKMRVEELVTGSRKESILSLIARVDELRRKRNESVHGVWMELEKHGTGEFAGVGRSRFFPDGTELAWDVSAKCHSA